MLQTTKLTIVKENVKLIAGHWDAEIENTISHISVTNQVQGKLEHKFSIN